MPIPARPEVAIVGGGLAGAAAAIGLARRGREVLVLERAPRAPWGACGVFTAAPARAWHDVGLGAAELDGLSAPIPVFRLVAPGGAVVPLTYGAPPGDPVARGMDRPRLDERLLALATAAGATVCRGSEVTRIDPGTGGRAPALTVRPSDGGETTIQSGIVIGADGVRSTLARAVGAVGRPRIGRRIALTFHVADPRGASVGPRDGWMVIVRGGYCGLAPVPGGRLNVGIVLDAAAWRTPLRRDGAAATARRILRSLPVPGGVEGVIADDRPLDRVAGIVPVAHRAERLSGEGWLLAGDAAGFLDPFTGEGIGRALATAELAACAVDDALRGDRWALQRYAAEVRARYGARDRLSTLVQRFLGRPRLFDYAARRLATRSRVRATLDLVLAERLPASVALDPRFLGAVLRP
jgi:flavin-dependent dehydrogenase